MASVQPRVPPSGGPSGSRCGGSGWSSKAWPWRNARSVEVLRGTATLFSARQAASHRARKASRSCVPPRAFTTCSRKLQRGTWDLRNRLCTVEELILPRPARIAISRIEGRPAFECRSSRRSKRSAIGPGGGTGSRLMAATPKHPPDPKYVQVCHVLHAIRTGCICGAIGRRQAKTSTAVIARSLSGTLRTCSVILSSRG